MLAGVQIGRVFSIACRVGRQDRQAHVRVVPLPRGLTMTTCDFRFAAVDLPVIIMPGIALQLFRRDNRFCTHHV